MLVETIFKKSSAKAAMAMTAAKPQEVTVHHHMVLTVADFAMLFGGVGEPCFLSKQVAKQYKRLKGC